MVFIASYEVSYTPHTNNYKSYYICVIIYHTHTHIYVRSNKIRIRNVMYSFEIQNKLKYYFYYVITIFSIVNFLQFTKKVLFLIISIRDSSHVQQQMCFYYLRDLSPRLPTILSYGRYQVQRFETQNGFFH